MFLLVLLIQLDDVILRGLLRDIFDLDENVPCNYIGCCSTPEIRHKLDILRNKLGYELKEIKHEDD